MPINECTSFNRNGPYLRIDVRETHRVAGRASTGGMCGTRCRDFPSERTRSTSREQFRRQDRRAQRLSTAGILAAAGRDGRKIPDGSARSGHQGFRHERSGTLSARRQPGASRPRRSSSENRRSASGFVRIGSGAARNRFVSGSSGYHIPRYFRRMPVGYLCRSAIGEGLLVSCRAPIAATIIACAQSFRNAARVARSCQWKNRSRAAL